ncbi:MAG: type IV toxin-antitoxin system AbiEi family antitoxin domain-containing protein, partial [Cellulomonadaceae bacterium]
MATTFPRDWEPKIANRQWGVFTRAQALAAGMTVAQVRHRLRTGLWTPVAGRGVRLARFPAVRATPLMAAALTWPDGVVCWQT